MIELQVGIHSKASDDIDGLNCPILVKPNQKVTIGDAHITVTDQGALVSWDRQRSSNIPPCVLTESMLFDSYGNWSIPPERRTDPRIRHGYLQGTMIYRVTPVLS